MDFDSPVCNLELDGSNIECPIILNSKIVVNIGAIIDLSSRVGKEQKTAMEVAIEDVNRQSCYKLALNFNNITHRNPSPTMLAAVTAIYEHSNFFASHSEILTRLSYSLSLVNAEIDHYVAFPSIIITLSNPIENYIEQELVRLKNKSNRVFLLIQSSLEFSTLLFEKVRQM
ncbi:hypothetical protein JHK82_048740 [Glycine max]|nr:hypothetical protein JHK82_048740 [Glycine max]